MMYLHHINSLESVNDLVCNSVTKIKREETGESGGGFLFLFPAPPFFHVPFSFASSPLSESLEQAIVSHVNGSQETHQ